MHLRERIEERLKKLADDPVPSDAKFLGRIDGEKIFPFPDRGLPGLIQGQGARKNSPYYENRQETKGV